MNNKMNSRWLYLLSIFLIFIILPIRNIQAQGKKDVDIGIVFDGDVDRFDRFFDMIKNEMTALLGSKYNIQIPADRILNAGWSAVNAGGHYDRLVKDPRVDIVLGLGILTGSVIVKKGTYPKPVIVAGILDPKLVDISPFDRNTSGIHNLTYFLFNKSFERDLDVFYSVYPYKKVGIAFYGELQKLIPLSGDPFKEIMKKNDTESTLLPLTAGIEDVLNALEDVDAIYLGDLGKFEGIEKDRLIDELNAKGIPTFGWTIADVNRGAMAAITPEENFMKFIRRISLDVEAILNGKDPADLPVQISLKEDLTLNMRTAKEIDFSPKFTILSEAELINEFEVMSNRVLNLTDVMREAMKANLNLKIEEGIVKSAQKEVSLARTNFLPSLTLGATGTQIDKDRAKGSFGQQAERTISSTTVLEQLIFSEQAIGNVAIQKHHLRASEYGYDQIKLDILLNAAGAYFDVLRAKTALKVRKDNVDLTKRNLEISKLREIVGYSGKSDVYRWESRLASATTDLLAAKNNVKLAKIKLNQLLNRPLDEAFIAQEASLTDTLYSIHLTSARDYINNPRSLDIYTNFLIEEAIRNSPEIRQLDAQIAGMERRTASFKRKRFVPTVGLGAQTGHVFSRDGAGSTGPGGDPTDDTWNVGINFNLPLFQGGATNINIRKARIEINKLNDQKSQLVQFVELNVRAAILEAIVKRVNLESSRKSADLAIKSLEMVQDGYSRGRVSITDLADAQNAALSADLAALNSEYEFILSMLKAERAVGKFTMLNTPQEQDTFSKRLEAYFNERLK